MEEPNNDPILNIKQKLSTKSSLKQRVYSTVEEVFKRFRIESESIIDEIKKYKDEMDPGVMLEVTDFSNLEFSLHFGGDLMIFNMQTNIVTFPADYYLMKNKMIQENKDLGYFGQILIYNFMADSVKYNRLQDAGYLLARLIINVDKSFVLEGVHGLKYMFTEIENSKITNENIRLILLKAMDISITSDLIAPPYTNIQFVSLGDKLSRQKEAGWDHKIGFQMEYKDNIES